MKLSSIVRDLPRVLSLEGGDPDIDDVVCDSRQVRPGALFAAVRGVTVDGHRFLAQAARAGAVACLVDDASADAHGMTRIVVEDVEEALGWASAAFWGHPSRALTLVGITGTNGKTTTSYLIQHILENAGVSTGRIGTVSYAFPGGEVPAPLTTPDAPTFQAALARMVREGAKAAVAEISSHALIRRRAAGSAFACTVFTNLSQDHLDYHGTMEEYYEAKRLLFTDHPRLVEAVVNVDDAYGRELAPDLGGHVVTFGLSGGDVRFEVQESTGDAIRGVVHFPSGSLPLRLPFAGLFNASNAAAALATAWALGLDVSRAVSALESAPQTPGRLEAVPNELGFGTYVDFAHTPDAVERVLEALRPVTAGRLICVFGCGGDRDRTKRPRMAEAASKWADVVVITADNSRSESTENILDEIVGGFPAPWRRAEPGGEPSRAVYVRLPDRREAIAWAVNAARPGDAVVVAGKGHETTQTIGGVVARFEDRLVLREALEQRSRRCG